MFDIKEEWKNERYCVGLGDLITGEFESPSDILVEEEDIKEVNKALDIVNEYIDSLEENEVIQ